MVFNIPIITNLLEPTIGDGYGLETADGAGRAAPESGQQGSQSDSKYKVVSVVEIP